MPARDLKKCSWPALRFRRPARYIDTPLALIGPPHFFTSLGTNRPRVIRRAAPGRDRGDAGLAQLGLHGGILKRLFQGFVERFTTAAGAPFGRNSPNQVPASKFCRPASLSAGTPGSNSSGRRENVAIVLTLFSSCCRRGRGRTPVIEPSGNHVLEQLGGLAVGNVRDLNSDRRIEQHAGKIVRRTPRRASRS